MLEFEIEWMEGPSVSLPALSATWGRIEIRAGRRPATRFWSSSSNSARSGVFGSAFPLARWIVRNWWSLLYEGLPVPGVLRGAKACWIGRHAWLGRHNLALSREGMPYPDLSIYREDLLIGVRWVPDGADVTTPGRFLDEGFVSLDVAEAEAAMGKVVEAVLERTAEIDDQEVEELRSDWQAIQASTTGERDLCARIAALGLDPHDPEMDRVLEERLRAVDLPNDMVLTRALRRSEALPALGRFRLADAGLVGESPAARREALDAYTEGVDAGVTDEDLLVRAGDEQPKGHRGSLAFRCGDAPCHALRRKEKHDFASGRIDRFARGARAEVAEEALGTPFGEEQMWFGDLEAAVEHRRGHELAARSRQPKPNANRHDRLPSAPRPTAERRLRATSRAGA